MQKGSWFPELGSKLHPCIVGKLNERQHLTDLKLWFTTCSKNGVDQKLPCQKILIAEPQNMLFLAKVAHLQSLRWGDCPGFSPGGPAGITRLFRSGRRGTRRGQRRSELLSLHPRLCWPWWWRKGPWNQERVQVASRSWKGRKTDSPQEPPEGMQTLPELWLSLTSDL